MQTTDSKKPRQRGQDRAQRDGLIGAAREMRRQPTVAEQTLWEALRRKQAGGMRFRRQRVIGPYIVDFCCLSHKLIVEVDGRHHHDPDFRAYDEDRTKYLEANGFRVLRFDNADVMQDVEGVVGRINPLSQASPLCGGERGDDDEWRENPRPRVWRKGQGEGALSPEPLSGTTPIPQPLSPLRRGKGRRR